MNGDIPLLHLYTFMTCIDDFCRLVRRRSSVHLLTGSEVLSSSTFNLPSVIFACHQCHSQTIHLLPFAYWTSISPQSRCHSSFWFCNVCSWYQTNASCLVLHICRYEGPLHFITLFFSGGIGKGHPVTCCARWVWVVITTPQPITPSRKP